MHSTMPQIPEEISEVIQQVPQERHTGHREGQGDGASRVPNIMEDTFVAMPPPQIMKDTVKVVQQFVVTRVPQTLVKIADALQLVPLEHSQARE